MSNSSRIILCGDTTRNRRLINLARDCGVPVVATNDALYHTPERYRLQHALVAAAHNTTIDRALRYIRPNDRLHLRSAEQMQKLFRHCTEALENTLRIADSCDFNLDTDLGYRLPDADVPDWLHVPDLPRKAVLRGSTTALRRDLPQGPGETARGIQAHRAPRHGGLSAAVQGDRADCAGDHAGTRTGES